MVLMCFSNAIFAKISKHFYLVDRNHLHGFTFFVEVQLTQSIILVIDVYLHGFGFPTGSGVKNSPAMQEMWVSSLGWEDPLAEEMATHSGILA